jgi:hypothetical protein
MANLFTILRKNDSPNHLCVRDLKPGMVVPRGNRTVKVKSVCVMDGRNGEVPSMTSGRSRGLPTAMTFKIEFYDHDPVFAHPGEIVR